MTHEIFPPSNEEPQQTEPEFTAEEEAFDAFILRALKQAYPMPPHQKFRVEDLPPQDGMPPEQSEQE